jgi:hypothetical protein
VLDLDWVSTYAMPADLFTKALPRETFERLRLSGGLQGSVSARALFVNSVVGQLARPSPLVSMAALGRSP